MLSHVTRNGPSGEIIAATGSLSHHEADRLAFKKVLCR
jgi:hypothetical protein